MNGEQIGEAVAVDVEDLSGAPPRPALEVRGRRRVAVIRLYNRTSRAVTRHVDGRETGPQFVNASPNHCALVRGVVGAPTPARAERTLRPGLWLIASIEAYWRCWLW